MAISKEKMKKGVWIYRKDACLAAGSELAETEAVRILNAVEQSQDRSFVHSRTIKPKRNDAATKDTGRRITNTQHPMESPKVDTAIIGFHAVSHV